MSNEFLLFYGFFNNKLTSLLDRGLLLIINENGVEKLFAS